MVRDISNDRTMADDRTIAADTSYIVSAQEGEHDSSFEIYQEHLARLRHMATRSNPIFPVGILETVYSQRDGPLVREVEYTALNPTGYHTVRLRKGKEWPHLRNILQCDGSESLVLPKSEVKVYGQVRTGRHPLLAQQLAQKMRGEVVEQDDCFIVRGYRLNEV